MRRIGAAALGALCLGTTQQPQAAGLQEVVEALRSGRDAAAAELLDRIGERGVGSAADTAYLEGVIALREGNGAAAAAAFEALQAAEGASPRAAVGQALAAWTAGHHDEGVRRLRHAARIWPAEQEVWANLGAMYQRLAAHAQRQASRLGQQEALEGGEAPIAPLTATPHAANPLPLPTIRPPEPRRRREQGQEETQPHGASPTPRTGDREQEETAAATREHRGQAAGPPPPAPPTDAAAPEDRRSRRGTAGTPPYGADRHAPAADSPAEAEAGGRARAAPPPRAGCWHAGPWTETPDDPEGHWIREAGGRVLTDPARSSVYQLYLGPFTDRDEGLGILRTLKQDPRIEDVAWIGDGPLADGISLGVYRREVSMRRRHEALRRMGVDAAIQPPREGAGLVGKAPDVEAFTTAWRARFPATPIHGIACPGAATGRTDAEP